MAAAKRESVSAACVSNVLGARRSCSSRRDCPARLRKAVTKTRSESVLLETPASLGTLRKFNHLRDPESHVQEPMEDFGACSICGGTAERQCGTVIKWSACRHMFHGECLQSYMMVHGFSDGCCFCERAIDVEEVPSPVHSETVADDVDEWCGRFIVKHVTHAETAESPPSRTEKELSGRRRAEESTASAAKRTRLAYGGT